MVWTRRSFKETESKNSDRDCSRCFEDKFLEQRASNPWVSLVLSKQESMPRVADCAGILLKPDPVGPAVTY